MTCKLFVVLLALQTYPSHGATQLEVGDGADGQRLMQSVGSILARAAPEPESSEKSQNVDESLLEARSFNEELHESLSKDPNHPFLDLIEALSQSAASAENAGVSYLVGEKEISWREGKKPVIVESRSDLPTVPSDATAEIYYSEAPLGVGPKLLARTLMTVFHSGLTIRWKASSLRNLTIQYGAKDFSSALVPPSISSIENSTWTNKADLTVSNIIDEAYWEKHELVATVDSAVLNKFFDFVAEYAKTYNQYQVYAVWKSAAKPSVTDALHEESTCDSFCERSIWALHAFGGVMNNAANFCRNVDAYISDEAPKLVKMSDDTAKAEVVKFYDSMVRWNYNQGLGLYKQNYSSGFSFIWDHPKGGYFKILLKEPYQAKVYAAMEFDWLTKTPSCHEYEFGNLTKAVAPGLHGAISSAAGAVSSVWETVTR